MIDVLMPLVACAVAFVFGYLCGKDDAEHARFLKTFAKWKARRVVKQDE